MSNHYELVAVVARIPSGTSLDYVVLNPASIDSALATGLSLTSNTGPSGATGASGATGLQGLSGVTGAPGPAGPSGDTGPAGPQGLQGLQGLPGLQGLQGPAGPSGATGPQGPAGTAGRQLVGLLWPTGVNVAFTNMPSAISEPFGARCRVPIDFSFVTECRVLVNRMVTGVAASRLSVEWSASLATWASLSSNNGPGVSLSGTGWADSGWTAIRASARTLGWLRLSGNSGDGAADPAFASILVEVR